MTANFNRILDQGVEAWNSWRRSNPTIQPNLSGIDLSYKNFLGANFSGVNFYKTILSGSCLIAADLSESELEKATLLDSNLQGANLDNAILYKAECSHSDFSKASFHSANLKQANLSQAIFCNANLINADLFDSNLSNADLSGANLTGVRLIEANVQDCILQSCRVYGVSVWRIKGIPKNQQDLIITSESEIEIRVDDLEVAQFVYLLISNSKIRNVIDTVAKKGVLILGRFTEERLNVLNLVRNKLRDLGYLPILFDFTKPDSRSFIETVSMVAHLSRFIIADFTEPRAVLEELSLIMQRLSIPLQPLVKMGTGGLPSTYYNLKANYHDRILEPYCYDNMDNLFKDFQEKIIVPAEMKAVEIMNKNRIFFEEYNEKKY
jgi:uncharacterized protein YjbI with pentapeptide repeats